MCCCLKKESYIWGVYNFLFFFIARIMNCRNYDHHSSHTELLLFVADTSQGNKSDVKTELAHQFHCTLRYRTSLTSLCFKCNGTDVPIQF